MVRSRRAGFKTGNARSNVLNVIITRKRTFGSRRFCGDRRGGGRGESGGGSGLGMGGRRGERRRGSGDERGQDMETIVNGGRKRRVLDFGNKEGRRCRWLRWKETDKLKCFGMRASTCNPIILGNCLVDGGGSVKKPVVAKL